MSASPAGPPNTTPNGGAPPAPYRRKPQANPLVAGGPRRPPPRKTGRPSHLPPPRAVSEAAAATNGSTPAVPRPTQPYLPPNILPDEKYAEYPVFTTKRALLDGLRHHVLRLQAQESISLLDDSFFRRPLHLYRRDPRHNPRNAAGDAMEIDSKEELEEQQARERAEAARDERRKQREENLALIAPSSQTPRKNNGGNQFQRRVENLYRPADTPEAQRRQQLRYEEALPWHLEDMPQMMERKEGDELRAVEDQNVWIGSYEAALSECHVMLHKEGAANGQLTYRLVPLEKWYKFTAKPKHRVFSAEEADKVMSKKYKEPKWIMEQLRNVETQKNMEHVRARNKGLFVRSAGRGDEDKKQVQADDDGLEAAFAAEMDEANEIDFEHDELFADDEGEGMIEGEDVDVKATEARIKREQLEANYFDQHDEKQVDEAEELQKKLEQLKKDKEKNTKKVLVKREKRFDEYASDSEDFESGSDKESSADEDKNDSDKDDAEKNKLKDAAKNAAAGGTSSKGANTPSGRTKTVDVLKKPSSTTSSTNLKRPGSPNLSDGSGNESSRKKQKKTAAGLASTTLPSRPISPDAPGGLKKSAVRTGAGSGSDTETGERRPRGSHISRNATPRGSPNASRAGSPGPGVLTRAPTADEIRAQIPPTGISTGQLLEKFGGKLGVQRFPNFINIVKQVSTYDKESKLLFPKGTPTGTPSAPR